MCGITGVIRDRALTADDIGVVRDINQALFHRGPDGSGEYDGGQAFFAMRRLSIIDLEGGWQPLFNEDKSIAVVGNGEIYNYVELRSELEARGHRFRTGSDIENVAHLYEEHGLEFVHRLRGMYALSIHDSRNRRVILVRDRMGEKPMYLVERPGQLHFSSELRALVSAGVVPFRIDPGAINLFYHYGYVPEPRCAILGVRKLPAAHMLTIDLDSWRIEQRRYWRMDHAPRLDGDPKTLIREQLEDIGRLIIRSEVPVGVALSGGLDSSVIAAIASRHSPGKIHALTIGYEGRPRQDERSMAQRLAEHLNMPFHEIELRTPEVVEQLPNRALWRDDPIADISGHGYFAVSKLARDNGIPVLLKGHGGDELFWGYPWVRRAVAESKCKLLPLGPLRHALSAVRALIPTDFNAPALRAHAMRLGGLAYGWRRLAPGRRGTPDELLFYNLSDEYQCGAYGVGKLFTPTFAYDAMRTNAAATFTIPRPWPDIEVLITRLICDTYLLENGMVQGDRLSMVSSVELRLPLCDYRLVETVVGLRRARHDAGLPPKTWLKEVAKEILPEWVLSRPKRGFTPPVGVWMSAMLDAHGPGVSNGFLVEHKILRGDVVERMCREHPRLSAWENLFYKSLVLEYWCRGMSALQPAKSRRRESDAVVAA